MDLKIFSAQLHPANKNNTTTVGEGQIDWLGFLFILSF